MRMIFVNLPVADLAASRTFFGALGFRFNPNFSDESAACMVVADNIFVMLLTKARFSDFITGPISDATQATEVLTCLSVDSPEQVDDLLATALCAGAKPWKPIMDYGFMYGCSFQDLDGHVWELMHMDATATAGGPPAS